MAVSALLPGTENHLRTGYFKLNMDTTIVKMPVIGYVKITASDKGVKRISFLKKKVKPVTSSNPILTKTVKELELYEQGKLKTFSVPVDIRILTDFTKRVLNAVKKAGYGDLITYSQLASAIKNKNAVRAVGNALGKNPVPIIIPCHRVIRTDGSIGGYGPGGNIKKKLLRIEKRY